MSVVGGRYEGPDCNLDINECLRQTVTCPANAGCVNTEGSYKCPCWPGFISTPLRITLSWNVSASLMKTQNKREKESHSGMLLLQQGFKAYARGCPQSQLHHHHMGALYTTQSLLTMQLEKLKSMSRPPSLHQIFYTLHE